MCLELPGRVVEIDGPVAIVETEGRRRPASTLVVPDAAVGDWVVVAAGTILERLTPAEAGEIRATLLRAIAPDGAEEPAPAVPGGA